LKRKRLLRRRLALGTSTASRPHTVAQRRSEFVAQIVPRVAASERHSTTAANECSAGLGAAVRSEQEGDSSPDRDSDHKPGCKDRCLSGLAFWSSGRPIGCAKSGRRPRWRFLLLGGVGAETAICTLCWAGVGHRSLAPWSMVRKLRRGYSISFRRTPS